MLLLFSLRSKCNIKFRKNTFSVTFFNPDVKKTASLRKRPQRLLAIKNRELISWQEHQQRFSGCLQPLHR